MRGMIEQELQGTIDEKMIQRQIQKGGLGYFVEQTENSCELAELQYTCSKDALYSLILIFILFHLKKL